MMTNKKLTVYNKGVTPSSKRVTEGREPAKRKRPVSSKSLKPFQERLRELHFVREWDEATVTNGVAQCYVRTMPWCRVHVKVHLAVKPDGTHDHRVTHSHTHRYTDDDGKFVEDDSGGYNHEDTTPVTFKTVEGMVEAINFEGDRDVKRAEIAKHFTKDFG
jgi:hypothetical protein